MVNTDRLVRREFYRRLLILADECLTAGPAQSLAFFFLYPKSDFYGKSVTLADRELVEQHCEAQLLEPARVSDICTQEATRLRRLWPFLFVLLLHFQEQNIALLVVGDPFGATTHTDLITRCRKMGVSWVVLLSTRI